VYYLCLIDWQRILKNEELMECRNKIIQPSQEPIDGWTIKPLNWPELADAVSNIELGFYHSRLIFKFDLKSTPKNIFDVRQLREKLQSKIEDFCSKQVIPIVKSYVKDARQPFIFIYPIFELNIEEDFWRFKERKPYSLRTTCFFTELDDRKGLPFLTNKVKMRISGAKIIASDMTDWFFGHLINIIFHEGLYRQARDKNKGLLFSHGPVYGGLENRLEDFASKLMTTFHEYSSDYVRRNIQKIALFAAAVGIFLTALILFFNLWK